MRTSGSVRDSISSEHPSITLSAISAVMEIEEYLPSDNSVFALAGLIADLGLELTGITES